MDRFLNFVWMRLDQLDWLSILLIFLIATGVTILWRANRSKDSKVDLDMLFVNPTTGNLELEKVIMFWAFLFSSWGLVALVVKGLLSEWYFIGYMGAWAASRGAYMWLTSKGANPNVPPPQ